MAARQQTPALDAYVAHKLNLITGQATLHHWRWPLAVALGATCGDVVFWTQAPQLLPFGFLVVVFSLLGGVAYLEARSASRLPGLSRTAFTQKLAQTAKFTRKKPIHPSTLQFLETGAEAYQTVVRCCADASVVEAAESAMDHLVLNALCGKSDEALRDDLVKLAKEAAAQSGLPESPDQEVRADLREALAKLAERREASQELNQSTKS